MENYKHILEEYRPLASQDRKQRIEFLKEPMWINYPRTKEIQLILENLMNQPKKPRMQNLLIIGESNIGKTSLIIQFAIKNPDFGYEDDLGISHPSKPVIIAQSPASADERGLYISVLECFWAPFRPTDKLSKLRHQCFHLLRECHVKMLIFDEIHNLLSGTAAKQRFVMNTIKSLSNELMIPIVGVGTQDAALILHSDPQHASRFDVVTLPKWELNIDFRSLLMSFESRLPLRNPSNLSSREKGSLLFAISNGNLGDLHRLLIECSICAINEGDEEITLDIIKKYKWCVFWTIVNTYSGPS